MPPSAATSQYPPPSAVPGHAHDGLVERAAAHRPWKTASPKEKMPPSDATSQYPPPSGVAAMPTMGALRGFRPSIRGRPRRRRRRCRRRTPPPSTRHRRGRRPRRPTAGWTYRWPGTGASRRRTRGHLGTGGRPRAADGDERVPHRPQPGDDLRQGGDSLGSVATGVVHVDDRAGNAAPTTRPRSPARRGGSSPSGRRSSSWWSAHGGDLAQDAGVPRVVGGRTHCGVSRHRLDLGLGHVDLRGDP